MVVRLVPVASTAALRRLSVIEQVDGELAAGLGCNSTGADRGEQCLGFAGGQIPLRTGGNQLHQQLVQMVHRLRAGLDQVTAPFAHQPQRDHLIVGHHLAQALGADRDDRDGARVTGVALAAVSDVEDPRPRRELRRNVEDLLPVGDQALRELNTHPAGAFDRPGPLGPTLRQPDHVSVASAVVADLQRRELVLSVVEHGHRVGTLGRVHPDHHHGHLSPPPSVGTASTGRPTSSEADPS